MESLLIPLAIFFAVAIYGVAESGRKFRRVFKDRGMTWEGLCTAMERGEGTIIVDMLWGPQRGLGRPVIWWSAKSLRERDELAAEVESVCMLVRCPRGLRSAEGLRQRFGEERVVIHTWNIDPAGVENSRV